jgi:hypothetical protein
MKLWMSGETQDDVAGDARLASLEVERTVNTSLSGRDYGQAVTEWALIHIILPFEDECYREVRKYHKRRKVVEFRLKIDHATFKAATPMGQRSLIVASLLRSIDLFAMLKISGFDHQAFRADLEGVAVEKGWTEQAGSIRRNEPGDMETINRQMIAVRVQYGGPEIEQSRVGSVIKCIREAAMAAQGDFMEGSGPAVKVIFCVAGSNAEPDWDHGRVTKYLESRQRLTIEAAVPRRVVESESAFNYLIMELRGANALAFEFYRQQGMQYPLAEAEGLVGEIGARAERLMMEATAEED